MSGPVRLPARPGAHDEYAVVPVCPAPVRGILERLSARGLLEPPAEGWEDLEVCSAPVRVSLRLDGSLSVRFEGAAGPCLDTTRTSRPRPNGPLTGIGPSETQIPGGPGAALEGVAAPADPLVGEGGGNLPSPTGEGGGEPGDPAPDPTPPRVAHWAAGYVRFERPELHFRRLLNGLIDYPTVVALLLELYWNAVDTNDVDAMRTAYQAARESVWLLSPSV